MPWNGPVQSKPTPCSEIRDDAYVFHDVSWEQPVVNRATLLCLNLIARNEERLQVARALHIAKRFMRIADRTLSIVVDGIYFNVPKRACDRFVEEVKRVRYSDLAPPARKWTGTRQTAMPSQQEVYKAKVVPEAKYPGGKL